MRCDRLWLCVQGILWVIDMYLASSCRDYRFQYEREAPMGVSLIEAVAEQPVTYPPAQSMQVTAF